MPDVRFFLRSHLCFLSASELLFDLEPFVAPLFGQSGSFSFSLLSSMHLCVEIGLLMLPKVSLVGSLSFLSLPFRSLSIHSFILVLPACSFPVGEFSSLARVHVMMLMLWPAIIFFIFQVEMARPWFLIGVEVNRLLIEIAFIQLLLRLLNLLLGLLMVHLGVAGDTRHRMTAPILGLWLRLWLRFRMLSLRLGLCLMLLGLGLGLWARKLPIKVTTVVIVPFLGLFSSHFLPFRCAFGQGQFSFLVGELILKLPIQFVLLVFLKVRVLSGLTKLKEVSGASPGVVLSLLVLRHVGLGKDVLHAVEDMFICHDSAVDPRLTVIVKTFLTHGHPVRVTLDEIIQFDDLLLLVVHFKFVVELTEHLLLPVEPSHLLSQLSAEHFVYHFAHV